MNVHCESCQSQGIQAVRHDLQFHGIASSSNLFPATHHASDISDERATQPDAISNFIPSRFLAEISVKKVKMHCRGTYVMMQVCWAHEVRLGVVLDHHFRRKFGTVKLRIFLELCIGVTDRQYGGSAAVDASATNQEVRGTCYGANGATSHGLRSTQS